MAPLILLIVSFVGFWLVNKYVLNEKYSVSLIGRIALALMLLMTGTAHFFKTDAMVQSMPEMLPFKIELVYFTGVVELLAAVGLVFRRTTKLTSILLIVFFICILPANIIGSLKHVELGGMENGPLYLWFRIPLQMLFIWWAYYFGELRASSH
jgi:uncharacterized membrane protein